MIGGGYGTDTRTEPYPALLGVQTAWPPKGSEHEEEIDQLDADEGPQAAPQGAEYLGWGTAPTSHFGSSTLGRSSATTFSQPTYHAQHQSFASTSFIQSSPSHPTFGSHHPSPLSQSHTSSDGTSPFESGPSTPVQRSVQNSRPHVASPPTQAAQSAPAPAVEVLQDKVLAYGAAYARHSVTPAPEPAVAAAHAANAQQELHEHARGIVDFVRTQLGMETQQAERGRVQAIHERDQALQHVEALKVELQDTKARVALLEGDLQCTSDELKNIKNNLKGLLGSRGSSVGSSAPSA